MPSIRLSAARFVLTLPRPSELPAQRTVIWLLMNINGRQLKPSMQQGTSWMSQSVQAYLDAQLCVKANWERLECELRKGRSAKGADCIDEPPVPEAEARG
jgi:hypothetical protein